MGGGDVNEQRVGNYSIIIVNKERVENVAGEQKRGIFWDVKKIISKLGVIMIR